GTTNPIYDQPINGPIDIYIGETGDWSNNVQIGNWAKLTTYIGPDGVNHSMHGDDDCGDQICGGDGNSLWDICDKTCFRNCYHNESKTSSHAGGQFMSGEFEDDWSTIQGAFELASQVSGESFKWDSGETVGGSIVGFLALLFTEANLGWSIVAGLGVYGIIKLVEVFSGPRKSQQDLDFYLDDNNMGPNVDWGVNKFFSIVDTCVSRCPKRAGRGDAGITDPTPTPASANGYLTKLQ
ncbi:MAG: hypothetical protein KAH01_05940, partial [Caldisericia bacterium]|nr:hypothetical protein [Caldisericia bacterium]